MSKENAKQRRHGRVALAASMTLALSVTAVAMTCAVAALSNTSMGADGSVAKTVAINQSSDDATDIDKSEVIYAKLDANGDQSGVYAVNIFNSDDAITVRDPGDYESVENLSTTEEIECDDGVTEFSMSSGSFSYQGNLDSDTSLPWNVNATYKLDGEEIDPDELGGASGKLEIDLDIEASDDSELSTFVDNYLLQVTATFDGDCISNIEAEDGSLAISGNSTVITYMLLPGSDAHYVITGDASEFEFDGFQIAGVALSLALNLDSVSSSDSLEDISQLESAIEELDDGAQELAEGSSDIKDALTALSSFYSKLSAATSEFNAYISTYSAQISSTLSELLAVSDQFDDIATGASNYGAWLQYCLTQAQTSAADLADATAAYQTALGTIQAKAAAGQPARDEDISALNDAVTRLCAAQSASQVASILSQSLQNYSELGNALSELPAAAEQLQSKGAALQDDMDSMFGNLSTLLEAVNTASQATLALADGYDGFDAGVATLAQGASTLGDATSGLDQQLIEGIRDEIESMLNPDFKLHSFVCTSNENVERVQFVYMTEGIKAPAAVDETAKEDEETMWDRVCKLFS